MHLRRLYHFSHMLIQHYILAAGLILSVVALGTSIEFILVVQNETKAKGRFIDLILSTAIVKDVLVIFY